MEGNSVGYCEKKFFWLLFNSEWFLSAHKATMGMIINIVKLLTVNLILILIYLLNNKLVRQQLQICYSSQ